MLAETARSGLPSIGDLPWGSHFCQFYRTTDDLASALVPFFKAGLDNNEQCLWVTCEPFGRDQARAALRAAAPDLDRRLQSGQIEIIDFSDWYTRGGEQGIEAVLEDWLRRKDEALARGYTGLRVSGDTCWIETREQWRSFAEYEAKVSAWFAEHRILALCSYHLDRCTASDTIEVVRNHQFALVRQSGEWEMIENASLKQAKEELHKLNAQLERRVAERTAELRESERRSRELLDALPAAIYTTDAAGRITYYNQAASQLAGRRPKLGRDKWCVTWRLYRPDGTPLPHDECPMAVALKENRPVRGEEAIAERPDGTRIPFIPYPTPLRDGSGALVGAVNMFVDITERKRTEEALRASEERLRAIFNSTAVGAAILTPAARFIQVNDAFCTITGYPREELHSLDSSALTHPDDRAPMEELIEGLLGGRTPSFVIEKRYIRRDGAVIWVQNSVSLTRDAADQPLHLVALCQDITERKRGEELLRASEERLAEELTAMQRLQETSTRLIHEDDVGTLYGQILDAAVAIMHSAMGSMQMLDPERGELRLLAWKGFDPASAAVWEWVGRDSDSSCAAALRAGQRVVVPNIETCDFLLGTPGLEAYRDAGIRAMQSTPLVSRTGRALGMISTHWSKPHRPSEHDLRLFDLLARQAADLIERAHAETALRDLNGSLERRIEERTRELEAAMAERQKVEAALQQSQRLEAIGQLTGGVAHDFNNLLTVVLGQSERIMAATSDGQIRRRVAAIQHAAERGARLNSQLLAFSRNQQLRPQRVVIERLMTNIDDLVRRAVGETIELTFSADPDLWPTLVDTTQFEAALLNLVINARDAMPQGGRLIIEARNAAVSGAAAMRVDVEPGDYVVVSVTDTGTGMTPHVREHAFEPFFTTKDVGKGTGLGLAQIYGFVKQSGGAADIETGVGRGTAVSLYLPRAEAEIREETFPNPTRPTEGSGKTVLVVEDQAEVREVIESALSGLGFEVLTASDGIEAREMLGSDAAIDLLLTDVVMPNGISGVDLAEEARRLRQDLRVVLVSGYPRGAQSRAGSGREEFGFLEKPFRQAELEEVIATAMNGVSRA